MRFESHTGFELGPIRATITPSRLVREFTDSGPLGRAIPPPLGLARKPQEGEAYGSASRVSGFESQVVDSGIRSTKAPKFGTFGE